MSQQTGSAHAAIHISPSADFATLPVAAPILFFIAYRSPQRMVEETGWI